MANAVGANGQGGGRGTGGGSGRVPRLPRWTRQEILVLIQGKRVVESRGRVRGRGVGRVGGGGEEGTTTAMMVAVEPKWASVSSYCRRHGVNRGAVQCRKRWSNLAGDFKKIKEWEAKGKESFWTMRNDLRRERRLPGFFDPEVYDILDGSALPEPESDPYAEQNEGKKEACRTAAAAAAVDEEEAIFDTGRTAAEDGLFSDFEEEKEAEEDEDEDPAAPPQPVAAVPISEKQLEWTEEEEEVRSESDRATTKGKQEGDDIPEKGSPSHQGLKRRRPSVEAAKDIDLHSHRLIEILERNSRMLKAQLEAQHLNCQLDRDQRKDQANGFLNVLSKLADALGKIADKL